ncbi:MAG: transporter [Spirochaetota bacterium]|nr:transporter [Spirochaetota bacterium]
MRKTYIIIVTLVQMLIYTGVYGLEDSQSGALSDIILSQATEGQDHSGHDHSAHSKHMDHKGHKPMSFPSGYMGGHSHKANHLMFTYRYMRMSMAGDLLRGSDAVDVSSVMDYMMVPQEMWMDMHMFGLMYTPMDNLVIMAMLPYIQKEMTMQSVMMPASLTTNENSGLGDLKVNIGYTLYRIGPHYFHLELGLGIPTGSIDAVNPANPMMHLSYPMQLGSGSYELLTGLSYGGHVGSVSWAAQFKGTFRLNENEYQYKLGNKYQGNAWAGWKFIEYMSVSLRLDLQIQDNITGSDPMQMAPTMMPGSDPQAYGSTVLNGLIGINFYIPLGKVMNKIGVEGGIPLYQSMEGVKRGSDYVLIVGCSLGYGF